VQSVRQRFFIFIVIIVIPFAGNNSVEIKEANSVLDAADF